MRTLIASLLLLALSACATGPLAHVYSGVYVVGQDMAAFYSFDGGDPYWVTADPDAQRALDAQVPTLDPGASARVRVQVQGVESPPGLYGHLGAYTRELHVTRVISAQLQEGS